MLVTALGLLSPLGLSGQRLPDFTPSPDFRSFRDHAQNVTFWRQRFDVNGDDVFNGADVRAFIDRQATEPSDPRYNFALDVNGDDRVDGLDMTILFDLVATHARGYSLGSSPDGPSLQTIASYYPWYRRDTHWEGVTSLPVRGTYRSQDPKVYLQQRLEAHAAGIDIFAVATFSDDLAREFHEMQAELERDYDPSVTTFLWLYEILGRLPWSFNDEAQEIVNFDEPVTRQAFVTQMVALAGYFHVNYLTIEDTYYPVWIWKTDTIRGNFVGAVEAAREAVRREYGKELVIIGGELAQAPEVEPDLERRLPAFFAMSHYGIYGPTISRIYGGRLRFSLTDVTIQKLLEWVKIVRNQGAHTIYGRPMQFWPPLQFGFDDSNFPGRNNPRLSASRTEAEYFVQQLDRLVMLPNRDIIGFLNHTSYNEHYEGHGLEPTDGYNNGREWLQIGTVYRGPSKTYRRIILNDPSLREKLARLFR